MALFARSKQATVYRAYLRGRMRGAGLVDDKEAKQYADPTLPTQLLVGFVLGALSDVAVPLATEAEVVAEVARRLAPAETPASTPPDAVASVDAEKTERVRPRGIGDPRGHARV